MFDFSHYSTESKYDGDSNTLVVGKSKDATAGVAINDFVGLKPKMYSFLVDDSSKHKKAKDANENVVVTISYNEYKNDLLKKKCLKHSMKEIRSKDHTIGAYEMSNISLSFFDDLALGCQSLWYKNSYLKNYSEIFIVKLYKTAFSSKSL